MALGAPQAVAQTAVSGTITTDAHWTVTDSPYVLSGDVVVQNGALLAVDAGVVVYMEEAAGLTIQTGGIEALGTAELPIQVRSDKSRTGQAAAPGDYQEWTFGPGTTATKLDHVRFEHGSGLVVQGSAPVFNYLDIRNNRGAAITIDLEASPAGVGNRASGNGLNGIAVPPGDIVGSVEWALLGIPYVVQAGTVSVGRSPSVTAVTPATLERGQTKTIAVDGVRLDGLDGASFDSDGLTVTPFSGGSSSRLNLQIKADADAELGTATLRLQLEAGEVIVASALEVTQPLPAITAISPTTVVAGAGVAEITVTGRNFAAQSEVLVNAAAITTQFVSSTELRASLPNQTAAASMPLQVRMPDAVSSGKYLLSNEVTLTVQMPVPPTVTFEPTPIAMPPDGNPHDITLRLSKADVRDHTINFSVSDPTKASVSPSSLIIAVGQTTARVSITPLAQGSVSLRAQSTTLGDILVPVFITQDFRGLNTSYAAPVGVFVEGDPTSGIETPVTVQSSVGVGVGAVLSGVSPGAWTVGATQSFNIHGVAIPPGSQVAIVPSTGLTIGAAEVSIDGTALTVPITAAIDAQAGPRRVVVLDNNGALLTFADAAESIVMLATGLPQIDSITPIQMARESSAALVVRGRNLKQGQVELVAGEGIEVDAQPRINADGTELIANVRVTSTATLGAKVVRVSTPAGITSDIASGANTLQVVNAIQATYSSVAPLVGVVVGNAVPTPDPQVVPVLTSQVGVVLGASVTDVVPRVGIIGSTLTVTIHGQGLDGVTSVSMVPATGLTLGAPAANVDGTELTFSLQVDAAAELGLRRLVLDTANGPLAFADVMDGAFLVSTPLPEVDSATPQVLTLGGAEQVLTLRGQYLTNVTDVRFDPSPGITVNRPFTSADDGTSVGFSVLIDAAAAIGPRTVIVTTAAGNSSSASAPGNTVTLAAQTGPTYSSIVSGAVGVLVGEGASESYDGTVVAPLVGVFIAEEPLPPVTAETQAIATPVKLLVGAVATAMDVDGWLQGASGTMTISGIDLGQVVSVAAMPAAGVLFDAVSINAAGTELSVPISVAQDASLGTRRLRLLTATGEVVWATGEAAEFGIGRVPSMDSVSPIVLTAGEIATLTIRGSDLAGVTSATLLPGDGAELVGIPEWSQDELGEVLKVTVRLQDSAATGSRVLQLMVPGGATSSVPSAVNSLTVVAGQ